MLLSFLAVYFNRESETPSLRSNAEETGASSLGSYGQE